MTNHFGPVKMVFADIYKQYIAVLLHRILGTDGYSFGLGSQLFLELFLQVLLQGWRSISLQWDPKWLPNLDPARLFFQIFLERSSVKVCSAVLLLSEVLLCIDSSEYHNW